MKVTQQKSAGRLKYTKGGGRRDLNSKLPASTPKLYTLARSKVNTIIKFWTARFNFQCIVRPTIYSFNHTTENFTV
jgi:hypothetical protein